jgi:hypothetical protein
MLASHAGVEAMNDAARSRVSPCAALDASAAAEAPRARDFATAAAADIGNAQRGPALDTRQAERTVLACRALSDNADRLCRLPLLLRAWCCDGGLQAPATPLVGRA